MKKMKRGWRREDGGEYWGPAWRMKDARILRERRGKEDEDGDVEIIYTVKVPAYLKTVRDIALFLSGLFHQSCSCSHDCCGHFFSRVWTHKMKHTKGREWTIPVAYQRNV